jgi:uncharacterized delta-60 repeat protein
LNYTPTIHTTAGALDQTFGPNNTGIVTEAIGRNNTIESIAIQADDSIISIGKVSIIASASGIAHFTANGTFDTTFNNMGYVQFSIHSMETIIQAIAIQPDAQIVVAGYILDRPTKSVIARYTPTGVLDPTFNGTGYVLADIANGCSANAVAIQGDGKIIIAGTAGEGTPSFFVARYNADGSADTEFGNTGVTRMSPGYVSTINALALQPDGKILAAGFAWNFSTDVFALARLNPDGSIDTDFGTDGIVTTQIGGSSQAHAMALQSDGAIVLAGYTTDDYTHYNFALARYDSTGAPDTTFNDTTGTVITKINYSSRINALALQPDGCILAGGYNFGARYTGFALARYLPTGTLDETFGTSGIVLTQIGSEAQINSLAFQANGNIIAAGSSDGNAALARYLTA